MTISGVVTWIIYDHFIRDRYRKEGNVLFNNTLNTCLFMVKDHSDSKKKKPATSTTWDILSN